MTNTDIIGLADIPFDEDIDYLCKLYRKNNHINPDAYERYGVKRGLRNSDGTGVMAGITQICNVHGYYIMDGERQPVDGKLLYRGININDIVNACLNENRYGFEETVWLLLFGTLPTEEQLQLFRDLLARYRDLPENFAEDMIFKAPSPNIMNKLERSVLALYSYDDNPDDCSLNNMLRQSIQIIARMPSIMTAAYQVKRRAYNHKSMYIHNPKKELSTAQNILRTLRSDKKFTEDEAHLLDLCLIVHAEHGGGNNSTFATRVLTSTGTDTYSAIAAGIGSLKGPRHGGANRQVLNMLSYIEEEVDDWEDEGKVKDYLGKILNKEAADRSGLIYGMGHAVYTKSDPRACILKENAFKMAKGTDFEPRFELLEMIERLTPALLAEHDGVERAICANVDLYSGLVYQMLRIPDDLLTPLFAISRTAGWCAHRIEEALFGGKIMRPAYKSVTYERPYTPLSERLSKEPLPYASI